MKRAQFPFLCKYRPYTLKQSNRFLFPNGKWFITQLYCSFLIGRIIKLYAFLELTLDSINYQFFRIIRKLFIAVSIIHLQAYMRLCLEH